MAVHHRFLSEEDFVSSDCCGSSTCTVAAATFDVYGQTLAWKAIDNLPPPSFSTSIGHKVLSLRALRCRSHQHVGSQSRHLGLAAKSWDEWELWDGRDS
jgi:hypothetical protein